MLSLAQISLGTPTFLGTGCSQDGTFVLIGADNQTVHVEFSNFSVSASQENGLFFDRKHCGLSIPITVPQGFKVAVGSPTITGSYILARKSKAVVHSEIFLSSLQRLISDKVLQGPENNNFVIDSGLISSSTMWSGCGESVILRINVIASLERKSRSAARINLDSLGGEDGVKITYRTCR